VEKLNIFSLMHIRKAVQGAFTGFCIYVGYRFYLYYLWMIDRSATFVPRPASVEGFLPISALVSFKKLLLTGAYDIIHPAGLTIFLAALLIAFIARKGFCGWICPVGFVSGMAWKLSRAIRKLLGRKDSPKGGTNVPFWINYPLLSLKYLILAFFTYSILWKMDLASIKAFAASPYNIIADAKMLAFFLTPSNLTLWVMGILIILSFFVRNFWCRFLCPYGALLGLIAYMGPTKIKRDAALCINCKKCENTCPTAIKITGATNLSTPECIGCLECIEVCPVDTCLSLNFINKKLHPMLLPIIVLLIFFIFYGGALMSGNWHQKIPENLARQYYSRLVGIQHFH
jgi:polyferredoxin